MRAQTWFPSHTRGTNTALAMRKSATFFTMWLSRLSTVAGRCGTIPIKTLSSLFGNADAEIKYKNRSIMSRMGDSVTSSNDSCFKFGSAWFQKKINIRPVLRGCHLVTDEILKQVPEIARFAIGLLHIEIMHTSASLALNENWDPDVREDMEMFLTELVPESTPFRHSCEGPDDMPAHIKSCFLGSQLSIPITDGQLNLGTWQGVWLCEHRNRAGSRKMMVTINGALKD